MSNVRPTAMKNPGAYTMMICIRRKPSMSRSEFQDYWLHHHGPLAASVHARGLAPPMLGYVQNHTMDTPQMAAFRDVRGMEVEPYDGITEVWLRDPEDLNMGDALTDELIAANQMLIEDEARFVDLERSRVFITRRHDIFYEPPEAPFYKMIICDRMLGSLSMNDFQDYWLNHHALLASSVRERGYAPPMLAYIQNHTVEVPMIEPFRQMRGMTRPAYDGIAEIWLRDIDDLNRLNQLDPEQLKVNQMLLDDELKFVDFRNSSVFMTVPHRIF